MESPANFPEAGHRAAQPWYRPATEADAAHPPTAEPGHRRADEPADPDRTAEWPKYQQ